MVGFARKLENEKFGLQATFNWRTYKTKWRRFVDEKTKQKQNRWRGLNLRRTNYFSAYCFVLKKIKFRDSDDDDDDGDGDGDDDDDEGWED